MLFLFINHVLHHQYKISAGAIPETHSSDRGLRIACQRKNK